VSEAFFTRPAPRWFTIPAHRPFVEDLARGLIEALTPMGPEALSDAIVLTPTRRAAGSGGCSTNYPNNLGSSCRD